MGDQRHGVDAVRQRTDIGSSGAFGEPPGLDGVEHVPEENRDRSARQYAAVHELRREAEHEPAERVDEEQLNEVVERQTEEPVDVAADDPWHGGENSSGGQRPEVRGSVAGDWYFDPDPASDP